MLNRKSQVNYLSVIDVTRYKDFLKLVALLCNMLKDRVDATRASRNLPTFNKYGSRYVYSVMQPAAHPVGCTLFRNHKQSNGYSYPKRRR